MKYHVLLKQTVIEKCTLVVEAANEEEAERIALKQSMEDENAEWSYDDSTDGPEVIDVEPIGDEDGA